VDYKESSLTVTQDNQVIESCYSMTLNEKRLLLLGITKVNPIEFPDLRKPLSYKVSLDEWNEYYPSTSSYRDFKKAAKLLMSRKSIFHEKLNLKETEVNWYESVTYDDKNTEVEMTFTRAIQVRLSGIFEKFTKYDLLSVNKLTSVYSIRLYEILIQYRSMGKRKISIDDLRFFLDCKDKYKATKQFKQALIKPAIYDIEKNSSLVVELADIRTGRNITHLEFTFFEKAYT
jgi:plasmid replication initiation protein